jgi:HNH endonuclease
MNSAPYSLMAHAAAPGHDLDVYALARAAGRTAPEVTYSEYGKLAHAIADATGSRTRWRGEWTYVIADSRWSGTLHWILYPEVVSALHAIGWRVSATFDNPIRDVDEAADQLASVTSTVREALVEARIGQGQFRQSLIELWGGCAVTGCLRLEALRAAHIKPWSTSRNTERLDPANGLLLLGTLDALFDAGLISLASDGRLICAKELTTRERRELGVAGKLTLRMLPAKTARYLQHHRKRIFRG